MSTDCPLTFSQGIFLRPKLCSYQVIKLPVPGDDAGDGMEDSESPAVSLMAGDYQGITAVVGRMIGWCERTARPPDANFQNSIASGPPSGAAWGAGTLIPVGP